MKNIPHSKSVSGIYCIVNTKNNKMYIGSSRNIYYRIARHISDLKRGKHGSQILQNAVNKHGIENFTCSILKTCNISDLLNIEKDLINKYKPDYNYILDPTDTSSIKFSKRKPTFGNVKPYDHPDKKKWIELYTLQGDLIKRFDSYSDAGRYLNLKNPDSIRQWVVKKRQLIHGLFQYKCEDFDWEIKNLSNYKKSNIREKRIVVTDVINNKILEFKSIKECSKCLFIARPTITIGCNTNKLIKNRYLFSWKK